MATTLTVTPTKITPTHVYTNNSPVNIDLAIDPAAGTSATVGDTTVQYRVLVGGTEIVPYGATTDIAATGSLCIPVTYAQLVDGANTVTIEVKNQTENSGSASVTVTREANKRTSVVRTFTPLSGGYVAENASISSSSTVGANTTKATITPTGTALGAGRKFKVTLPHGKKTAKVEVR